MAEEIPKKTVMVLLALVIVVSVLSTFVVLTAVGESREYQLMNRETVGGAVTTHNERTSSDGTVSLVITKSNEE